MANEKCGACGSLKTSVLGGDKRVGKTCGNEDCKLHLTVIDWPPEAPPAPPAAPPAGVGADLEAIRSLLWHAGHYWFRAYIDILTQQRNPDGQDMADHARKVLATAEEAFKRLATPPAGPAVDLEALRGVFTGIVIDSRRPASKKVDAIFARLRSPGGSAHG